MQTHDPNDHAPNDAHLLHLFRARDERALESIQRQYGRVLRTLAQRIVGSACDAEEIVNDALLDLWNTVPPEAPSSFLSYASVLVRRRSIDRVRYLAADKRAGVEYYSTLEELEFCLPDPDTIGYADGARDSVTDGHTIRECVQDFLDGEGQTNRRIFMLRYFRFCPLAEIAAICRLREEAVSMRLTRMRRRLKKELKCRGIDL